MQRGIFSVLLPKKVNRFFAKTLFSYVIILLIPLIVFGIAYCQIGNIMEQKAIEANNVMLNQLSQMMDSNLKEVEQLFAQISLSPDIKDIVYMTKPFNAEQRYKISQAIKSIYSYKLGSKFIDDIYIYFSAGDIILTPTTKIDPFTFYETMYYYPDKDYQQWVNDILHGRYYSAYFSQNAVSADTLSESMVTYIQTIPIEAKGNSFANVVLLINKRKLENLISDTNNQSLIYIIDQNNNVVVSTNKATGLTSSIYDKIKSPYGSFSEIIEGNDMVVSYISSRRNGWRFLAVTPRSVLMAEIEHVRSMVLYIIALYFLGGIIVSYLMAYKNYNPIRSLINAVTSRVGRILPNHADEYKFIHEVVISTLDKNDELEDQLYKQNAVLKTEFIRNILNGNAISEEFTASSKIYNISFPSDRFIVLLFHIGHSRFKNDISHQSVIDIIEESMADYGDTYTLEVGGNIVAMIICCGEEVSDDDLRCNICAITRKAREFAQKKFEINLNVSLGKICSGIANINDSYQQALSAMNYGIINGYDAIMCYNDSNALKGGDYYYPIEIEMQLRSYIKAGDEERAFVLLDRIFKENFEHRVISSDLTKYLFFDMIGTVRKTVNEINLDCGSFFADYDHVAQLLNHETIDQMYADLKNMYHNACVYIKQKQRSHNDVLKKAILDFIDKNYSNKNMSLSFIADHLGITPTYLSHFFKEQVGYNISVYINMIRIAHAKELLKDKDLPLMFIAEKVGYNNDVALIRAFKKHEDITPGQYRDSTITLAL